MARRFDYNSANYMSRGSVNFGLNGATACSLGVWIKITATHATEQVIAFKQIDSATSWYSFGLSILPSGTTLQWMVNNKVDADWPTWVTTAGIGTGGWHRILCAWNRTAGTSADSVLYVDGAAVTTTFTANGYTSAFTIEENSNSYLFGQNRTGALNQPLDADLEWVCLWNRQLSAQEALYDYWNPCNVTNGLISRVEIGESDRDEAFGGSMTKTGTLHNVSGNTPIHRTTRLGGQTWNATAGG